MYKIEELIDEFNSIKETNDEYYKGKCFYHEIVIEIYDYLRHNKVKKDLKWLYDIMTTYFEDCGVLYKGTERECFAFPYEKPRKEIYDDTSYHYNKRLK